MDLICLKIIVAFLFGLIRFGFGIFPIKVYVWLRIKSAEDGQSAIDEHKRHTLEFAVALVQAFGGGVLFATSFLHMMPQVYVEVEELKNFGVLRSDYPYSQLIVSLGFFVIYFTEEMSNWVVSITPAEPVKKKTKISPISKFNAFEAEKIGETESVDYISVTSNRTFKIEDVRIEDFGKTMVNERIYENEVSNGRIFVIEDARKVEDMEKIPHCTEKAVQTRTKSSVAQNMENNLDMEEEMNAEIEEFIEEEAKTKQQMLRCFLMVMALSLHAIFEGLAIGLQRSATNIWYLFTAVSIHSATILFCMGLELVLSGVSWKATIIHMSMLSTTSPIGVLLGLLITITTNIHTSAKSFAIVLLEGLSAGTILYITFFETLKREKERRTWRILRAVSIEIGFALMALLQLLKLGS